MFNFFKSPEKRLNYADVDLELGQLLCEETAKFMKGRGDEDWEQKLASFKASDEFKRAADAHELEKTAAEWAVRMGMPRDTAGKIWLDGYYNLK